MLLPEYESYAGLFDVIFIYLFKWNLFFLGSLQVYFVVILTRRGLFKIHGFEIIPYPGTMMNRNLVIVHVNWFLLNYFYEIYLNL